MSPEFSAKLQFQCRYVRLISSGVRSSRFLLSIHRRDPCTSFPLVQLCLQINNFCGQLPQGSTCCLQIPRASKPLSTSKELSLMIDRISAPMLIHIPTRNRHNITLITPQRTVPPPAGTSVELRSGLHNWSIESRKSLMLNLRLNPQH